MLRRLVVAALAAATTQALVVVVPAPAARSLRPTPTMRVPLLSRLRRGETIESGPALPEPRATSSPSRWRKPLRIARVAAGAALVLSGNPGAALSAVFVDEAVIEAAEAARSAVRAGSLMDRVITDHIDLLTTIMKEKQAAKWRATRNVGIATTVLAVVGYFLIKFANRRGENKLREQEIELFGSARTGSAIPSGQMSGDEALKAGIDPDTLDEDDDDEEDVIKRAGDDPGPEPRKPK